MKADGTDCPVTAVVARAPWGHPRDTKLAGDAVCHLVKRIRSFTRDADRSNNCAHYVSVEEQIALCDRGRRMWRGHPQNLGAECHNRYKTDGQKNAFHFQSSFLLIIRPSRP